VERPDTGCLQALLIIGVATGCAVLQGDVCTVSVTYIYDVDD